MREWPKRTGNETGGKRKSRIQKLIEVVMTWQDSIGCRRGVTREVETTIWQGNVVPGGINIVREQVRAMNLIRQRQAWAFQKTGSERGKHRGGWWAAAAHSSVVRWMSKNRWGRGQDKQFNKTELQHEAKQKSLSAKYPATRSRLFDTRTHLNHVSHQDTKQNTTGSQRESKELRLL